MTSPVTYKKPRLVNIVSVTLALVLGFGAYFSYQYIPIFLVKQEAYRILEETGSRMASHASLYEREDKEREKLRRKLDADLRILGVRDPDMETWIEIDGNNVEIGVIYSDYVEFPLDIFARREFVQELVHKFTH